MRSSCRCQVKDLDKNARILFAHVKQKVRIPRKMKALIFVIIAILYGISKRFGWGFWSCHKLRGLQVWKSESGVFLVIDM